MLADRGLRIYRIRLGNGNAASVQRRRRYVHADQNQFLLFLAAGNTPGLVSGNLPRCEADRGVLVDRPGRKYRRRGGHPALPPWKMEAGENLTALPFVS